MLVYGAVPIPLSANVFPARVFSIVLFCSQNNDVSPPRVSHLSPVSAIKLRCVCVTTINRGNEAGSANSVLLSFTFPFSLSLPPSLYRFEADL